MALVDALLAERPDADLRDISVDAAYERMGSKQLEWIVIPGLMFAGFLLTYTLCMPLWIHGFDKVNTRQRRPIDFIAPEFDEEYQIGFL